MPDPSASIKLPKLLRRIAAEHRATGHSRTALMLPGLTLVAGWHRPLHALLLSPLALSAAARLKTHRDKPGVRGGVVWEAAFELLCRDRPDRIEQLLDGLNFTVKSAPFCVHLLSP